MNRLLGIILVLIGIAGIAITSIPEIKPLLPFSMPAGLSDNITLYVSIVIALVGLSIFIKSKGFKGKQMPEVPIYQGKSVVGYRRMK